MSQVREEINTSSLGRVNKPLCSELQQPLQEILHQETKNAECENKEQDEGAELTGV